MIDFEAFSKFRYQNPEALSGDCGFDLFISAFNDSERIERVFGCVDADEKVWVVHPEYEMDATPVGGDVVEPKGQRESEFVRDLIEQCALRSLSRKRLCIDITGFVRPHLLFLLRALMAMGVQRVECVYSEPGQYVKQEQTRFSDEIVTDVRQVEGFEGIHSRDSIDDLLVVGVGYDHVLLSHVANAKDNAAKVQLLGLPSLRPDMYQESVIRVHRASESVGVRLLDRDLNRFAPAYDPFVTASVLDDIVRSSTTAISGRNVYLSALGTKAQVLGFGLYYLWRCEGKAVSLIYPFHEHYSSETSVRCGRVWRYVVEFP
jgi:hypothetical protein